MSDLSQALYLDGSGFDSAPEGFSAVVITMYLPEMFHRKRQFLPVLIGIYLNKMAVYFQMQSNSTLLSSNPIPQIPPQFPFYCSFHPTGYFAS